VGNVSIFKFKPLAAEKPALSNWAKKSSSFAPLYLLYFFELSLDYVFSPLIFAFMCNLPDITS
jgi:hypothetical protein